MSSEKFTFKYDEREICLLDSLPQIYHPISDFRAMSNVSGEEVSELYKGVTYITANAFINTSSDAILSKWEKYLKITPNGTDTLDERRFRILAKLNDFPPYTDHYLVKKLTDLCGADNFRITREYDKYKILVEVSLDSIANTDSVMELVKSIIPANLELTVRVLRARHNELEGFTHEYLANYTQDQITYREALE